MKPFRFLHAADLHLDSPFKGLSGLPELVRNRIKDSTLLALHNVVETALRERVDFVVFGGDVYDLADRSLRAQFRFQQAVQRLADNGIPVYIVHGNHDPLDGARARLDWPEQTYFFGAHTVETVVVQDRDGEGIATVSGISYGKSATADNLAARFPKPDPHLFAIGLLHCNVDGVEGHDNYAPCTRDQLARAGYDYWALGHIHTRNVLMESPPIVYPGNIQGRHVNETGVKGCYVVHVREDKSTQLVFHPTSTVVWDQKEVSIQQWADEQQLKNGLDLLMSELIEANGGIPVILRLKLSGRGPLHGVLQDHAQLKEWLDELRAEQMSNAQLNGGQGTFVWIESVRVETGAEIQLEQLSEQDNFIGDLLRISEQLLDDDEVLMLFCKEALAPLMNHAKASRLLRDVSPDQLRSWLRASREQAVDELLGEEAGAS